MTVGLRMYWNGATAKSSRPVPAQDLLQGAQEELARAECHRSCSALAPGSVDIWIAGGAGRLVPLAGEPNGTLAELADLRTGCWGGVGVGRGLGAAAVGASTWVLIQKRGIGCVGLAALRRCRRSGSPYKVAGKGLLRACQIGH